MTDEPDKSGKPIKAALVLFALLLSALALLAGCKPPAQAAFLRDDDDIVQLIKWTQEGIRINGTIDISERKPDNEIRTALIEFDGVLDGENVSMTLKSSWTPQGGDKAMKGKITGFLTGDTLTLLLENGLEPIHFRRATPAKHAEATRKLQMRAKLNKGAH
jgi:hypothetical protein